jgi:putative component of membrane protein insertase Oxa1/YidC/SpoIIIJ protein YidD
MNNNGANKLVQPTNQLGNAKAFGLVVVLAAILLGLFSWPCRTFLVGLLLAHIAVFFTPFCILHARTNGTRSATTVLLWIPAGTATVVALYFAINACAERSLRFYQHYSATDAFDCPIRLYRHGKSCSQFFHENLNTRGLFSALWQQDSRFQLCAVTAHDETEKRKKEQIESYEQKNISCPQMSCCWDYGIWSERSGCGSPIPSDGCWRQGN